MYEGQIILFPLIIATIGRHFVINQWIFSYLDKTTFLDKTFLKVELPLTLSFNDLECEGQSIELKLSRYTWLF
jgi:hypothetical protein